jgi:hypothetical protein
MQPQIRSISHIITNVGKLIKASKKKISWKFLIGSREYTVDLYLSRISNKTNIHINDVLSYTKHKSKTKEAVYPFEIDENIVMVSKRGNKYDLIINTHSFHELHKKSQPVILDQNSTKIIGRDRLFISSSYMFRLGHCSDHKLAHTYKAETDSSNLSTASDI